MTSNPGGDIIKVQGVNDMCEIFEQLKVDTITEDLKSLIKNLNLSLEEAMKVLEIKSEDKDKYRKLIN